MMEFNQQEMLLKKQAEVVDEFLAAYFVVAPFAVGLSSFFSSYSVHYNKIFFVYVFNINNLLALLPLH